MVVQETVCISTELKQLVTGDKYFALTPSADNITSFSGNQENEGILGILFLLII